MKEENISIFFENIGPCPECGENDSRCSEERGEIVCARCGLVRDQNIIDPLGEKNPSRRTETSIYPRGTFINIKRDAFDRKLSSHMVSTMYHFKKIYCMLSPEERRALMANAWLEQFLEILKPNEPIKKEAKRLLAEALKKFPTRGRSLRTLALAVINLASKIKMQPIQEIDKLISDLKINKNFFRTYRILIKSLDLKVKASTPEEHLNQISGKLNISQRTILTAYNIIKRAREKDNIFCGKDPKGIAAGALYLSCKASKTDRKTQKQIAKVSGVTAVTLRNRTRDFQKILAYSVY